MKKKYCTLSFLFVLLIAGCNSSRIIISWKKRSFPVQYSKIMVAGIIKSPDDSLRLQIEKALVNDLRNLGYSAVSAYEEFGPGGLSNLGQAETYLKLCNRGIDAVIVLALVDQAKENKFKTQKTYAYPDNYYYDRIWNYKNIQADITSNDQNASYFWEMILFNLSTLEAECTIQTSSFKNLQEGEIGRDFEKQIVQKMVNEKILQKQKSQPKKPF